MLQQIIGSLIVCGDRRLQVNPTCDCVTEVDASDISVVHFPSQQTFVTAFSSAPDRVLMKKVTGKVTAVQHLQFTKKKSAATSWNDVTIECIVLVDSFESVVSVDISRLRPFLEELLFLHELFVFTSFT